MTTGNIYSQVYDPALGKYKEIWTGFQPIKVIRRYGDIFSSKLLPYSGLSIGTLDSERILMYPIDIGSLNFNSGYGVTVGYSNQIYNIAPTGGLNIEAAPISLGESNLISGVESVIIGNGNVKYNSWYSYSLGKANTEQDTAQIYVIGRDNGFSGALEIRALGTNNFFMKSPTLPSSGIDVYNLTVIGDNNLFASGVRHVNLLGNNNSLTKQSNYLGIFGNQNTTSNTSGAYNLILGQSNSIESGDNIYVLGFSNVSRKCYDSYTLGRDNVFDSGDANLVLGRFNQSTNASGNNLIGNTNVFNGDNNNVFGNTNNISLDSVSNIIFGNTNEFSGSNNHLIFGLRNSDQSSSALTVVGTDNTTSSNSSSCIIGQNNEYISNNNSYVFGNQNSAENSNGSFVFGSANSVSGFQNYIIGNNNTVRSGDFNSILIGISSTFTGDYKVASVNIVSVDSSIEVNTSDIKLVSPNRPKINGENIIIQSEFDTISNSIKQNSSVGLFNSNVFQDPNYTKLADRIILPSFNYNSGASTNITSPQQELTGTSSLSLNNFNIFSTTSYTGPRFNVIFGNHTNSQFSPAWLVVDRSTSGVYYKNDIIPFNATPQSGWTATGFAVGTGTTANIQINLKMGTRTGFLSSSSSSFGTFYIPIVY
jgi:hypothetical protein